MQRRRFIASALVASGLPKVAVLSAERVFRIGWVTTNTQGKTGPLLDALRGELEEFGYIESNNLRIEARDADEVPAKTPEIVHKLVADGVDLIVTQGTATRPVAASAGPVPVVFIFSGDPVAAGLTSSLARPSGNCTGISLMEIELNTKRLELLHDILPGLTRAAILASPEHPGEPQEQANAAAAAKRLGIELAYFPVTTKAQLEASFAPLVAGRSEAIVVFPDPVTSVNRDRIVQVAMAQRVPVISGWALFAQSGALCTYGPRLIASYQRAAYFVDRILRGAKPRELPIEQPSVLELVVNLKSARDLGIAVPLTVLAGADDVIE